MDIQTIYIIATALLVVLLFLIIILVKRKKKAVPKQIESLDIKLKKSHANLFGKIAELLRIKGKVDEDLMDDLEEVMLQADVGVEATMEIIDKLRQKVRDEKINDIEDVHSELKSIIIEMMKKGYYEDNNKLSHFEGEKPFVILFTGVNGVGKTTTIAKLSRRYVEKGKKVILIAADTFRAGAIEQLNIWAKRTGAAIAKQHEGADPSSVVFDGLKSAVAKKYDVVIIDTAGRQHTKANLMKELSKISRTIKKVIPEAPHESLLVVDATTGQNAIIQAKMFNEATELTGLVLTKLDGTAKGGIVIGIKHQLNIPVKLIGVGEKSEDLRDFDAGEFVEAII